MGADNLPREMPMDLGASGSMDIKIYGWGDAPDIKAPSRNQISKRDPFQLPGAA